MLHASDRDYHASRDGFHVLGDGFDDVCHVLDVDGVLIHRSGHQIYGFLTESQWILDDTIGFLWNVQRFLKDPMGFSQISHYRLGIP